MSNQKGYTTVELATVLAIALILAFLAIDPFSGFLSRRQLRETSQAMVGQIRLARQKAIAEGVETVIVFEPTANRYRHPVLGQQTLPSKIRFGVPSHIKVAPNEGSRIPPGGVRFGREDEDAGLIESAVFKPNGTPLQPGTIYLTNSRGEAVGITVNITGRVKQHWWNGHAWQ
jgi:type II secretory pathway pseudopilin PulG